MCAEKLTAPAVVARVLTLAANLACVRRSPLGSATQSEARWRELVRAFLAPGAKHSRCDELESEPTHPVIVLGRVRHAHSCATRLRQSSWCTFEFVELLEQVARALSEQLEHRSFGVAQCGCWWSDVIVDSIAKQSLRGSSAVSTVVARQPVCSRFGGLSCDS